MFLDKKLKNFDDSDFKEASGYAKKADYLSPKGRRALYNFGQTLQRGGQLSAKQLSFAESLIEELKELTRLSKEENNGGHAMTKGINHLTVRQAWHDNKWNGRICNDPSANDYCIGDYSLLSTRIRHRRNEDLECNCAGCVPNAGIHDGYIPPCYWSINTFGDETFEVIHKHPMSRVKTSDLKEQLGSTSVFTWPFKLSFINDKTLKKQLGSYPKNLETRIKNYFDRIQPQDSIAFTYCNYDNPVSGDDQLYLITGCGLVRNVIEPDHFKIENYDQIKSQEGNQNFPTINWSSQVQLDKDTLVRIPYHEYLTDAEESGDFNLLNRIKVVVNEPQLVRCFKYVSMDVSDDEAIFLLTKIKRSLDLVKEDGFYKEYPVDDALQKVENLLKHCWQKRGYFPGFAELASVITGRPESSAEFAEFMRELMNKNSVTDQYDSLTEILDDPDKLEEYGLSDYEDLIFDLHDAIQAQRLTNNDFLKLSLIDLLKSQFERIVEGDKDNEITSKMILDNPYLLYELYRSEEWKDDPVSGNVIFGPIDLFKIDIAYFPDRKYLKRIRSIQNLIEGDNRRIRAIVIQHLENLENQGHCFDWDENIMEKLLDYPLFYKSDYRLPNDLLTRIDDDFRNFLQEKLEIKEDKKHFYFYLRKVYEAEEQVANTLHKLLDMEELPNGYYVDLTESVRELSEKLKDNFNERSYLDEREKLYDSVFKKRLYILTGVPGSGKSYELLRTIDHLTENGESYTLLAPTGKAVLRLTLNEEGLSNIDAKTIDKFLKENEGAHPRSIEIDNLIIDEMSMVDLLKFHELLNLINFNSPKFKRLILVGDPNQLPPIGYGKVFVDVIEYVLRNEQYHDHIVTLETNCRVEQDSRIKDVTELFAGHAKYGDDIVKSLSKGDARNIDGLSIGYWKSRDELRELITSNFLQLCDKVGIKGDDTSLEVSLNRLLGLRDNGTVDNKDYNFQENLKIDRFQIISPYRAGYYSSLGLNMYLQKEFKKDSKLAGGTKFKRGDKVIQTQNKYDRNGLYLSNGSMGVFKGSGSSNAQIYFLENKYPQNFKKFDEEEELELAFAITVHKSQGSGFDHTFIVIPNKKTLLSKEMVYTALTRSKKSLSLFIYGVVNSHEENYQFLTDIIDRSDIATRRTTLMDKNFWGYSLSPEDGVKVKSRAEYIIYKKLQELSDNRTKFGFKYERLIELKDKDFDIKPDFTIDLPDGTTIYWEHLGMLNSKKYVRDWIDRKELFINEDKFDRVITTDESHGLNDSKIEALINDLAQGEISGLKNGLSNHHFYLA